MDLPRFGELRTLLKVQESVIWVLDDKVIYDSLQDQGQEFLSRNLPTLNGLSLSIQALQELPGQPDGERNAIFLGENNFCRHTIYDANIWYIFQHNIVIPDFGLIGLDLLYMYAKHT